MHLTLCCNSLIISVKQLVANINIPDATTIYRQMWLLLQRSRTPSQDPPLPIPLPVVNFSNRSHALNPTNNLAQKPHHNKKLQQVAMHPVDSEIRHDVSENIAPLNPEIKYEIPKKISTTKTTSLSLDVRRTQKSV